MRDLQSLLDKNKNWAEKMKKSCPTFFEELAHQQSPQYLWIGCSDSRVPANQIVDLPPGEVFVHRNVANLIVHSDLNCLSVIQYAVDVLKVKHIIVCGHYGCGGILATLNNQKMGLIDNWLRHVQDTKQKFKDVFDKLRPKTHWDILCELNVLEQAINVAQTTVVQDAWNRGQDLAVHGWIYKLHDGLVRDLKMGISDVTELSTLYAQAIEAIHHRYSE
ncbi:carbonate dehydratase [Candidatus Odyssella acanthamoebae]|uniref:Carbonic anhydrase n=1 Tax=Candidatus Odyssella acanthamoebae TaxID=91604 RepID=A0A077AWP1_9PROT|nr:carbonate dehydratase [Candidatus Paracaedibacter acanthamoebae]AIK96896.1 carbonate dehydratase [Candidatus Paracaedibacter acanthamoebae]